MEKDKLAWQQCQDDKCLHCGEKVFAREDDEQEAGEVLDQAFWMQRDDGHPSGEVIGPFCCEKCMIAWMLKEIGNECPKCGMTMHCPGCDKSACYEHVCDNPPVG